MLTNEIVSYLLREGGLGSGGVLESFSKRVVGEGIRLPKTALPTVGAKCVCIHTVPVHSGGQLHFTDEATEACKVRGGKEG